MIAKDKKQYIAPKLRAVELNANTLLAGSNLSSGGDNTDGPKEAESKKRRRYSFEWEEE